jgi:hypothetical protein
MTSVDMDLYSESEYILPSMPFSEKAGAFIPVLRTWGDESILAMMHDRLVDDISIATR